MEEIHTDGKLRKNKIILFDIHHMPTGMCKSHELSGHIQSHTDSKSHQYPWGLLWCLSKWPPAHDYLQFVPNSQILFLPCPV